MDALLRYARIRYMKDAKNMTWRQIGKEMKISYQRAQQIYTRKMPSKQITICSFCSDSLYWDDFCPHLQK